MASSPSPPIRRRLEGLLALRVVLITLLLGGAIVLDVESLSNLAEFRSVSLLGLIISSYLLAIGFAVWLRRSTNYEVQGRLQVLSDVIIVGILVPLTGGLDSLFAFLFHVTIISAAVIVGRTSAITIATVAAVALVVSTGIDLQWVEIPDIPATSRAMNDTAFRLVVNVASVFLVAVLAGYLSDRLGRAQVELKERQGDLEKLRALNQNILSSMSSGVLTIDPAGAIIFFNRAAERITGLLAADVLGSTVDHIFPELISNSEGETKISRGESTFKRTDGTELYLGFSISPLMDSEKEAAGEIVIFQDLTAIRGMEDQVRRSERLAAVGELSAAIAHEIRNPLASISGAIEMLQPVAESSEDEILRNIILREVDRLDHLISDFLDYSRPHELKIEEFEINALIEEVHTLISSGSDASIRVTLGDQQHRVKADSEATRQILWNLIRNAVEASDDLEVEISVAHNRREFLIVSIEDSGPGVAPELRDRVFQPFFTTKEDGTGLGLATTFRLAEEQGGTVCVLRSSRLGGARFDLLLPRV